MPQYPQGFTPEEYDELRDLAMWLAKARAGRPFHPNDLLIVYMEHRRDREGGTPAAYNAKPVNAGSVAQILEDLRDLGALEQCPDGRYQLANG